MQYKLGDFVVHPNHGVGKIVRIEEKQFFEAEPSLYYEISIRNGTVWVPVKEASAADLRTVVKKKDLSHFRNYLKSPPIVLDTDYRKRQAEISARLREGTFEIMCEVVRDLTAHSWKKPLSEGDAALLHKVQENLCYEWSVAEGIPLEDAHREVETILLEAREAFSE
jgi:RNA polymerase-interacting CarD/CdnL/TRCF family regulator